MAFDLDGNLREYATDRQWEILETWAAKGSQRSAAKALGVHKRTLAHALDRVRAKAARAGYITPETSAFHMRSLVPAGFVLKGQSAYVDDQGAVMSRWDKTKQAGMEPEDARVLPDPKKVVKLSSMLDADGKVVVQWLQEKPEEREKERLWRAYARELAQTVARVEPTRPPTRVKANLTTGYPVGDHHLGMLSWGVETGADYDLEIGERLLRDAVGYLVHAAGASEHGIVAFLGDFMHYDSHETVTPTNRNALDSDTRFGKLVRAAVRCMRTTIDEALRAHRTVHVIVESGNHDLASTVFLTECLSIAYEREPRVTVDTSPAHFHYYRFGKVLLGTHHGHGTKMQNLPLIMAADRPEDWGATQYRYWWTGHIHKSVVQPATSAQDYSGCVVESFRVLPPADAWASQKGYRPHRDMRAVVFHQEYGEVARHTVNSEMLRE